MTNALRDLDYAASRCVATGVDLRTALREFRRALVLQAIDHMGSKSAAAKHLGSTREGLYRIERRAQP